MVVGMGHGHGSDDIFFHAVAICRLDVVTRDHIQYTVGGSTLAFPRPGIFLHPCRCGFEKKKKKKGGGP